MTVIRQDETKVLLPRVGADEFWSVVQEHYAGSDEQKWRYLAMLALRENAGWPLEFIGGVFGHSKGHVTRCLDRIKSELRARFRMAPEMMLDAFSDETEDLTQRRGGAEEDGEREG